MKATTVVVSCVLALAVASAPAWAAGSASQPASVGPVAATQPATLVPGGVADLAGKILYVEGADGKVEAVNAADGQTLWVTADACVPLIASADRALVRVANKDKPNQFSVRLLDATRKGELIRQSKPVELPEWVVMTNGLGKSFSSACELAGNQLRIRWQASTHYWGGAAPSPEMERNANKLAVGVATIQLDSGDVDVRAQLNRGDVDVREDPGPRADWKPLPEPPEEATLAGRTLSLVETPAPRAFGRVHRVLKCTDPKTQTVLWQHDLGSRFDASRLPPPP